MKTSRIKVDRSLYNKLLGLPFSNIIIRTFFIGQKWVSYNRRKLILKLSMRLIECNYNTIVDIGCGEDYYSNNIFELINTYFYIGVDISETALKIAKQTINTQYKTHKDYILADVKNLPFRNKSIDLILIKDLIHHIINPFMVLKEVELILKKDVMILESTRENFFMKLLIKRGHNHLTNKQLASLLMNGIQGNYYFTSLSAYVMTYRFLEKTSIIWDIFITLLLIIFDFFPSPVYATLSKFFSPTHNLVQIKV